MPYRRRAKRDRNERKIVAAIRQLGAQWLPLNVTDGPDGVIGFRGTTVLAEIKTDTGQLRTGQFLFHQAWPGGRIVILRSIGDVVQLVSGRADQECGR